MKAYESIKVERDGPVAHLQLHRPERINALPLPHPAVRHSRT